jgi:hypothetical protein
MNWYVTASNYTEEELVRMPIKELDMMAFGCHNGQILTMPCSKIKIVHLADMADAYQKMEAWCKNNKATPIMWAKQVSQSTPVDIDYQNGRFQLGDGHHRYLAAKLLKIPLTCIVTVKDKPVQAILKRQQASKK